MLADSSSPLLAAYYDRQMGIIGGVTYVWKGDDAPERLEINAVQVGVGRDTYYALDKSGRLLAWRHRLVRPATLMRGVAGFAAERSGVLAIKKEARCGGLSPCQKPAPKSRRTSHRRRSATAPITTSQSPAACSSGAKRIAVNMAMDGSHRGPNLPRPRRISATLPPKPATRPF